MASFYMTAGIVGGIISLLAYIPYGIAIIRDRVGSGNKWLIWTLSNFLIFLSYYAVGARTTIWVPLAYFIGSAIVTILAYIYSQGGWTMLHKGLLSIAILSAVRWWFFASPFIALAFNVFIDFIGYMISIKSHIEYPERKRKIPTLALLFAGTILNLLAVTNWNLVISAYPIFLFIMNGIVFALALKNYLRQLHLRPQTIEANPN